MHCLSQLVLTSILFSSTAQDLQTPDSPGARVAVQADCPQLVKDRATGNCVFTSSVGTIGALFPLSVDLNVTSAGNVGIGTTAPTTKLEVAGTLTLNPPDDQALDIKTGSIYKGGQPFIHTKGGTGNSAFGLQALANITAGFRNTASGYRALYYNTTGVLNTASGFKALYANTTGSGNTASGYAALYNNTTGSFNTASGQHALSSNTTGLYNTASGRFALSSNTTGLQNTATGQSALSGNATGNRNTASGALALSRNTIGNNNTASGLAALFYNTTGDRNISIGCRAGFYLTGDDNIAIGNEGVAAESGTIRVGAAGTHTSTFIAGIRGMTTVNADAIPVMIDSAGQLGTVSSSRRFKEDIRDMADATERLLDLRPVLFRYKERNADGNGPQEYGLIAEEVAEVFPDLVVYDAEGKPFTVKYHLLSSMLLNELQKQDERLDELEELKAKAQELDELKGIMRELQERMETVESMTVAGAARAVVPSDSR